MSLATLKPKIEQLIEKAQSGGGGLPDWDDDSPIIATDNGYENTNVYWELTEKGTFRWKIRDVKGKKTANVGFSNNINALNLSYLAIASKIRQIDIAEGIETNSTGYAINCERIRLPNSLKSLFVTCIGAKELDLNHFTIASLSAYHFSDCRGLEKVILPSATTTLSNHAFNKCFSLKEINLENITSFGASCFADDFSFDKDLVFNENLTSIGTTAFNNTLIKTVKFQNTDTLPSIQTNSFLNCRSLTDIYCPWAEGAVANAPWGATNATIHYNSEV